jgi:uncharacterized protein YidB (DUF937 family)
MGLFDSVVGAVLSGQQAGANAGAAGGGLGGVMGMLANNPQLLQAVLSLLDKQGAQGGLGGLLQKFQQAGLGDVIASWVGSGENQPISGAQLGQVLGADALSGVAAQLGVNPADAASQLSRILPGLIDQLTPQGQAPAEGLGQASVMGLLGSLLGKR